ncbi:hypothetical protein SAMN05443665_102312 [Actinomadura meyerae]|uniref:Uncharacterized protein n=1 Tax=Actinomadura meyerae TaxID=240840 RepID=A0A239LJ54_9ACTN|nr:hypothetical protein [Actinomadura meyerae]SNT30707.1 hypothetical protein SAMN05443665_102312 [Actinomadura meyerae]
MRLRTLLLTGLVLTSACTGQADGGDRPTAAPSPERPAASPSRPAAAPGSLANPRVMNCANRNASFPGERSGPVKTGPDDLVVEPLIIPGLRGWADADPAGHGSGGRYKVGVVVRAGKTATLSVPDEYREAAGLLYADAASAARTPAEADHAITFSACPGHDTPFPGFLFVPRRQRVPLLVQPEGGEPTREVVSFFAGG